MNRVLPERDESGRWRYPLVRHPESPEEPQVAVAVAVERIGDMLHLEYRVTGDVASLVTPAPSPPVRRDGLWQHNCFEMFIAEVDGQYREYNFAPSGEWAAYAFDGYRAGMRDLPMGSPPSIRLSQATDLLICAVQMPDFFIRRHAELVSASIPPSEPFSRGEKWTLKQVQGDANSIGLSAVLEDTSGQNSYWALSHPDGKADFHHPACFHPFPAL